MNVQYEKSPPHVMDFSPNVIRSLFSVDLLWTRQVDDVPGTQCFSRSWEIAARQIFLSEKKKNPQPSGNGLLADGVDEDINLVIC